VILSATIDVSPVEEETTTPLDRVSIEWIIMEVDGTELGQMNQNNVVPRGQLDERWGSVASLAAQAAVETLEGVLGQIATSKKLQLRPDNRTALAR